MRDGSHSTTVAKLAARGTLEIHIQLKDSQQHKHAQFIPLPPREEFSPFPDHVILRNEDHEPRVPFRHYISRLPQNKDTESLFNTYRELLRNMNGESEDDNVSYNFVMTTQWMFISPRERDDYRGEQYKIAVNSTGMVGLLLTKSPEESDFLERVGPATILGQVGKPWS
jgi:ATP adenylyltransferase/5',5'''-P-1,P-4-tetraphosphate phosphorylase II